MGAVVLGEENRQVLRPLSVDSREARQLNRADTDGSFDLWSRHGDRTLGLIEDLNWDEGDVALGVWPRDVLDAAWPVGVSSDPASSEPALLRAIDEELVANPDAERRPRV